MGPENLHFYPFQMLLLLLLARDHTENTDLVH